MYIAIYECIIYVILHIFKISYQLQNIEQWYLPGKMADNMHSHEKVTTLASCFNRLSCSWDLEKLEVSNDLYIPRFGCLNMKTIFCTLRITNSGIQFQFHRIEYLSLQDWWDILKNRKNDSLLHRLIFISNCSHLIWFIWLLKLSQITYFCLS